MPASGKKDEMSQAELEQRSKATTRHGGAGAVKRVRDGRELTGIARDAELAVYDELETEGRYALVIRNAARLQACADLYWNAVSKAASDGDLDGLDRYIKRYGWLAGVSLRAWAQVAQETPRDDGVLDYEAILAAQEAQEGDGD